MLISSFKLFFDYCYIFFYLKEPYHNNTLFVRLDGIGDTMIWSNVLLNFNLNKKEKSKNILVTKEEYAEFYKKLYIFDDIITLNHLKYKSSLFYRLSFFKLINNLNIETAINPVYSNIIESFNDPIIFSTKAKIKIIGPIYKSRTLFGSFVRNFKESIYNLRLDFEHDIKTHEYFYGFNLLTHLGYDTISKKIHINNFNFSNKFNLKNNNFIIIAPGSSSVVKNWPTENYITLVNLLSKFSIDIITLGSAKEIDICNLFDKKTNIINLCAKTTLTEMCELIANSKMVISNDTSSIHIATFFNVPSVCINWGAGLGRFLPYPNDVEIGYKPIIVENYKYCTDCFNTCTKPTKNNCAFCIDQISTNDVLQVVEKLLNRVI